jgi:hypothetical protein
MVPYFSYRDFFFFFDCFIPGLMSRTHRVFVPFEGLTKRKGIHFIRNKIIIYLKTEQLCLLYASYELIYNFFKIK